MFEVGQEIEVIDSCIFSVAKGSIGTITDISDSVIKINFEDAEYGTNLLQTVEVLFGNLDLFEYAKNFILPVGYITPVEEELVLEDAPAVEVVETEIMKPE